LNRRATTSTDTRVSHGLASALLWQMLVAELMRKGVLDRTSLQNIHDHLPDTPATDLAKAIMLPLMSS
jgi:hypothetical protein